MIDSSVFSSGRPFGVIELDGNQLDMPKLHAHVLAHHGRLELTHNGQSCILISKMELQSLEEALEILANTDTCRDMRAHIASVVRCTTQNDPILESDVEQAATRFCSMYLR